VRFEYEIQQVIHCLLCSCRSDTAANQLSQQVVIDAKHATVLKHKVRARSDWQLRPPRS
jgi:hypothetical protein